ncbi:hypothetical protein INT45_006819 [Circinella minor]|uniref:Uncharacterized protein n=1 Tax=Circinella minor TaxID=1195481 RepID=A0A8H7VE78_9FUNG|nr:hypothetical protein INT45_006819 [Circinella minor]
MKEAAKGFIPTFDNGPNESPYTKKQRILLVSTQDTGQPTNIPLPPVSIKSALNIISPKFSSGKGLDSSGHKSLD